MEFYHFEKIKSHESWKMNEGCWHSKTFCHFLLWRREFCFDVVGNFELKKMTPNCIALAKSITSYLWVSYYTFVFSLQCKTMLFTNKKSMQWRHRNVRIALRDINKKGIEIGERQNRCHDDDDIYFLLNKNLISVINFVTICIQISFNYALNKYRFYLWSINWRYSL